MAREYPGVDREIARTLERLARETRVVYHSIGRELSDEKVAEHLEAVLEEVWPRYLAAQLGKSCGIEKIDDLWGSDSEDEDE